MDPWDPKAGNYIALSEDGVNWEEPKLITTAPNRSFLHTFLLSEGDSSDDFLELGHKFHLWAPAIPRIHGDCYSAATNYCIWDFETTEVWSSGLMSAVQTANNYSMFLY